MSWLSLEAAPSVPSATSMPSRQAWHRADAGAEDHVGDGIVGDADTPRGRAGRCRARCTRCSARRSPAGRAGRLAAACSIVRGRNAPRRGDLLAHLREVGVDAPAVSRPAATVRPELVADPEDGPDPARKSISGSRGRPLGELEVLGDEGTGPGRPRSRPRRRRRRRRGAPSPPARRRSRARPVPRLRWQAMSLTEVIRRAEHLDAPSARAPSPPPRG